MGYTCGDFKCVTGAGPEQAKNGSLMAAIALLTKFNLRPPRHRQKRTDGNRIAKPPTPHSSLLSPGAQGRGPIEGSQSLGPADVADLIPGNPSGRQSA